MKCSVSFRPPKTAETSLPPEGQHGRTTQPSLSLTAASASAPESRNFAAGRRAAKTSSRAATAAQTSCKSGQGSKTNGTSGASAQPDMITTKTVPNHVNQAFPATASPRGCHMRVGTGDRALKRRKRPLPSCTTCTACSCVSTKPHVLCRAQERCAESEERRRSAGHAKHTAVRARTAGALRLLAASRRASALSSTVCGGGGRGATFHAGTTARQRGSKTKTWGRKLTEAFIFI